MEIRMEVPPGDYYMMIVDGRLVIMDPPQFVGAAPVYQGDYLPAIPKGMNDLIVQVPDTSTIQKAMNDG